MSEKYIKADGFLYKRVDDYIGARCPLCGSSEIIIKPEDEIFKSRKGCLGCDTWFEDPQLKEKAHD